MNFTVTTYELSAHIPKDLTLAFVSDLHDFPNEGVLCAIKENNVDAVLVGGDFIHGDTLYKRGFDFLKKSADFIPTFCILGNHESGFSGDIRTVIKNTGATLLDNDYVTFKGIKIGGLTSGYYYPGENYAPDVEFLTQFSQLEGYKLLLCHHPEYYPQYIKDLPIDLILSGHAHGGQWRFFGRGIYAPGQGFLPKYTSGIYDDRLIVCRGLGNLYFIPKINNKPEFLIVKLKKQIEE